MPRIKLGQTFETARHGPVTVIGLVVGRGVLVEFADGSSKRVRVDQLRRGAVRNPMDPRVCGMGYAGRGHPASGPVYAMWLRLLRRCAANAGERVVPEWLNFQAFADDYLKMAGAKSKGWSLNRSLLSPDVPEYGPATCVLLPRALAELVGRRFHWSGDGFLVRCVQNGKAFRRQCASEHEARDLYASLRNSEIMRYLELHAHELDDRAARALRALAGKEIDAWPSSPRQEDA